MSQCIWIFIACCVLNKFIGAAVLHTKDRTLLKDASISNYVSEAKPIVDTPLSQPKKSKKSFLGEKQTVNCEDGETNGYVVELDAKELLPSYINSNEEESSDRDTKKTKNDEILSRIELALSKSKENKSKTPEVVEPQTLHMVPIFKPTRMDSKDAGNQTLSDESTPAPKTVEKDDQNQIAKDADQNNFVITGAVLRPLVNTVSNPNFPPGTVANNPTPSTVPSAKSLYDARRASPTINLGALAQTSSQNLPCAKVTNCDTKKDATVVFYKPETVSLEQAYGDFMKKLTMTVLVPLYTSKLAV